MHTRSVFVHSRGSSFEIIIFSIGVSTKIAFLYSFGSSTTRFDFAEFFFGKKLVTVFRCFNVPFFICKRTSLESYRQSFLMMHITASCLMDLGDLKNT